MSVDLDRLLAHLDPDGRGGRRHVDEVATAICALAPHIDAAAVPELVRDTIQAGERQGMWSSTRTVTVHRGRTTLPKSIILPRSGAPADQLRPVAVPCAMNWRPGPPHCRCPRHSAKFCSPSTTGYAAPTAETPPSPRPPNAPTNSSATKRRSTPPHPVEALPCGVPAGSPSSSCDATAPRHPSPGNRQRQP